MRRNRIILLILWCLSLLGISFYGGAPSYGIFAVLTLIPVISLVYILFVFILFKIYQNLEGRDITCDRTSVFYFTLQNESPIAFSGIRVIFYSTFSTITGLDDATEYELPPGTGIKKRTEIVCHYMGEYEVGIKKVVITDFLRLFSFSYPAKEPFRVFVKPNIVHLTELQTAAEAMSAARESAGRKSEPDIPSREYVRGDDTRLINWKATGVSGRLMVREMTGEEQQGVGLIMDSHRYSDKKEEYLPIENKIMETSIALTLFFTEQGIPVKTCCYRGGLEELTVGRDGFQAYYDRMCSFTFGRDEESKLMYGEILNRGTLWDSRAVFMVVHKWDTETMAAASALGEGGIPVVVYVITADPVNDVSPERLPRTVLKVLDIHDDLTEVM